MSDLPENEAGASRDEPTVEGSHTEIDLGEPIDLGDKLGDVDGHLELASAYIARVKDRLTI